MNNLEWIRTLSAEELIEVIDGNKCNRCAFFGVDEGCTERSCSDGRTAWLNAEHVFKIKPCANCGGKAMFISDVAKLNPEIGYVQCCECHIRTPVGKKHNVVNMWNRRANDGRSE